MWLDSLGGLFVGASVLALSGWLADLHGLPYEVIVFMGGANVAYGSFSLSIQLRRRRMMRHIALLAGANVSWLAVCVALALMYRASITAFGVAHLLGEGVYVAGLGALEWRRRQSLVEPLNARAQIRADGR